jgi:site-specific recombinase XerD
MHLALAFDSPLPLFHQEARMTPLRKRMIEDLQIRNRSDSTIRIYVAHVAHFARHFGCSPEQMGSEEARQYQLHLLQRKVSWSNFNQVVCALRFLYGTTLGRPEDVPRISYGRRPKTLPVVLSRDEVMELLTCITNRKHRMVLTTMYATGMRLAEAVALSVNDIDSRQMTILVARGKGNKQRLVPMTQNLLQELRLWWRQHRSPRWMFLGGRPDQPLGSSAVGRCWRRAVKRVGLRKPAGTHSLRHTFATELLEAGIDLPTIQKILGHASLRTTAKYIHVRRDHLQATCRVLDLLPLEKLRTAGHPPEGHQRRKSVK